MCVPGAWPVPVRQLSTMTLCGSESLRYARAAWETEVDPGIVDDAYVVLRAEKLVSKSGKRRRRPSNEELSDLTEYFRLKERRRSSIPMRDIIWFGVHSARRQSEITRLLAEDNDAKTQTGMVRDLKHPTGRIDQSLLIALRSA